MSWICKSNAWSLVVVGGEQGDCLVLRGRHPASSRPDSGATHRLDRVGGAGIVKHSAAPPEFGLSAEMLPPCASTMLFEM